MTPHERKLILLNDERARGLERLMCLEREVERFRFEAENAKLRLELIEEDIRKLKDAEQNVNDKRQD